MECAGWSNEVFDKYVKHRHTLELNKLRKAKQRSKSKLVTSVIDQQVAGTAHSVSPSPPSSVVNISSASSISAYSPSAATQPIQLSPTAIVSAPSDQVVTRTEFDSLKAIMMSMASDLASLRKGDNNSSLAKVHGDVSPSSVVDLCDRDPPGNPMLLPLVGGGLVPVGESCPTLACPEADHEPVGLDRSRKRVREVKDVSEQVKRQRPPSRPRASTSQRGSSPWPTPEVLRHHSLSVLDASLTLWPGGSGA